MNTPRGSPRVRLISSLAMLAVAIGGVSYYSVRMTGQLFDIGVNAYIHCLGTDFSGVMPALGSPFDSMRQPLLDAAGAGWTLESAHPCTIADRAYVTFVLRRGQTSTSVILTQRGAQEDFPRLPTTLHTGSRDGYSVAAFESGAFLAYIISTLPARQNRELAVRLEPVIDRFTKA
jgi:hypothetical protein